MKTTTSTTVRLAALLGLLGLLCLAQSAAAFYNPELGRWATRDPIGELGGYNLYRFDSNDPLDRYDPFGEADFPKDQPPTTTSPPIFGGKPFKPGKDNCLCYALDRPGGELQPDGGIGLNNEKKCKDLVKQIKKSYNGGDVSKDGNCPQGSHKVAVFADGDGGYHVQRQDSGGTWSEMSLNPTYPPRQCKRGSSGKDCGDICLPDASKTPSPSR